MKIVVALVFFFVAAVALEKRKLFGTCVEECSMNTFKSHLLRSVSSSQCPDGKVCASNGCGHTCQSVMKSETQTKGNNKCSGVMCFMYCEYGFQNGTDGCPICKCNESAVIG